MVFDVLTSVRSQGEFMVGRVKDYVCLTSVSVALNVAVKVIQLLRQDRTAGQHSGSDAVKKSASLVLRDANPLEG